MWNIIIEYWWLWPGSKEPPFEWIVDWLFSPTDENRAWQVISDIEFCIYKEQSLDKLDKLKKRKLNPMQKATTSVVKPT